MSTMLTVDVSKQPRLKALRARLRELVAAGDDEGANQCSDLILDLLGLRPFKLGEKR